MRGRALCFAFVVAFAIPSWCFCPEGLPPKVHQFIDVRGRPLKLVVGEVHLTNLNRATLAEQQQISSRVIGFCFLDGNLDDLKGAIRDAFQQAGFFEALVDSVDVTVLDKSADPPTVTVTARIEEGYQYRLKHITFSGNKAIANTDALRGLIPVKDGDVFNTEGMRNGIKKLRDAYGALGYINFTPVPDTDIDDKNHAIAVKIDIDEGMQFFVRSFDIAGVDPVRKRALLGKWVLQPGQVFNQSLVEFFFASAKDLLPAGTTPEKNIVMKQDNQLGVVDITLDLTASSRIR